MQVSNKPRSQLEEILQRVAPDKEVMIGISNYNLIPAGELVSFLDVSGSAAGGHNICLSAIRTDPHPLLGTVYGVNRCNAAQ